MFIFFFFNDTATTEIYTLSLHDALPISHSGEKGGSSSGSRSRSRPGHARAPRPGSWATPCASVRLSSQDRKSTRLNSSHGYISYAVFCLKKKNHYHTYCSANIQSTSTTT